jgi:hypothetical protein
VDENVAALDLPLSDDDITELDLAIPLGAAQGDRSKRMASIDT